jgi:hypothetical protein
VVGTVALGVEYAMDKVVLVFSAILLIADSVF